MAVFWDIASFSLIEIDRLFRVAYCVNYRPDDGGSKYLRNGSFIVRNYDASSQKTAIFSMRLSRLWNLSLSLWLL